MHLIHFSRSVISFGTSSRVFCVCAGLLFVADGLMVDDLKVKDLIDEGYQVHITFN